MRFILQFTTGEKFIINQDEAEAIGKARDDQSITIKRLGMIVQKRMCLIYPEKSSDRIEDRKKQTNGRLHDGSKATRHFGQWVDANNQVADDKGNYGYVRFNTEYYPEVAMDCVASEEEYKQIKESKSNYYEFLGISERIKRIDQKSVNNDFRPLIETQDDHLLS